MNSFGRNFRVTTWGESHGVGIGAVIDGCPAGLPLSAEDIQVELDLRKPGQSDLTTPRKESDTVEILSGVFQGTTTGTPISLLIRNRDVRSSDYETLKEIYRPGHADFTFQQKYGIRDHRGSGRASGRETACRVAAGAVAKKLLARQGMVVLAFVRQIGTVSLDPEILDTLAPAARSLSLDEAASLRQTIFNSTVRCPHEETARAMIETVRGVAEQDDSVGGIIEVRAYGLPAGLGEPVFGKLDACLAGSLLSIGAVKGIEFGEGFRLAALKGSQANDPFKEEEGRVVPAANRAGGVLGGISSGAPLNFRVVIKPTASIKKPQDTVNMRGEKTVLSVEGRHDPCIAVRVVSVIEHMTNLVLVDLFFSQILSTLNKNKTF